MDAFSSAALVLGVMAAVYIIAQFLKLSVELSLFAAAIAGGLAGGAGIPPRQIVEGAFTYFDIILIFITATVFMNIFKESGGVAYVVRGILSRFHDNRALLLILLSIILLIPGALTGAGSVTVLIAGGLVSVVLTYMGLSKPKISALIFIIAGLSAVAPPVSLWAMLAAAGVNMPYVGFFLPLLVPCVALALLSAFILGWKGTPVDLEKALLELPKAPDKMNAGKVILPFAVFLLLVLAGRISPYSIPILGLPLIFTAAAVTSWAVSPLKLKIFEIAQNTVQQLLPLVGTLTCVGILVQIMTLTGARGFIAINAVTLPLTVVIFTLFLVLPVSEAVLMYGAAPVLGVPLVLLFNTAGLNPIVALSGMSVIWFLGDAIPPTAIIGRLTVSVTGQKEKYPVFLKHCIVPAILVAIVGTLMVYFSKQLGFLTLL